MSALEGLPRINAFPDGFREAQRKRLDVITTGLPPGTLPIEQPNMHGPFWRRPIDINGSKTTI